MVFCNLYICRAFYSVLFGWIWISTGNLKGPPRPANLCRMLFSSIGRHPGKERQKSRGFFKLRAAMGRPNFLKLGLKRNCTIVCCIDKAKTSLLCVQTEIDFLRPRRGAESAILGSCRRRHVMPGDWLAAVAWPGAAMEHTTGKYRPLVAGTASQS